MAWLSRVNFISSDTLSFTDINNLGNDIRAWGDNVNGGGYTLSNVALSASSGTMATVTGGTGAASTLTIRSTSGTGTSDAIVFQTASQSERMRITSGGNVGIGTASPSNKLTVLTTGTLNTAGDFIDVGATFTGADYAFGAGGNPAILNVHSNSTLGAGVGATIGLGGRYTGTSFGQFAIIKGAKENATDGNFATFLAFGTRANGGNITERMRIDSSGNVGIGTSSPQGKLAIGNYTIINALDGGSASSDIGNNLRFDGANWRYLNTGAASLLQFTAGDTKIFTAPSGTGGNIATLTERMQITSSGNVGIGTSSPATSAKLEIAGTTGALLVPRLTTTERNALTAVNGMIIYNTTDNQMQGRINGAWVAM